MDADFPANPFRPGPGQTPPVLAGRENVQRTLLKAVHESREQGVGGSPIVLVGPRGNGKTVLMGWLMDQVADRMDVAWLSSDDTASREDLARSLSSHGVVERVKTLSGKGGVPGVATGGVARQDRVPVTVESALAERVSGDGLLVMVDEAHVIESEAGRTLLAAWQKVARNRPVMLMLAGTPGLEARLRGIGATFGGRKNRITLDGLEPEAAVQAIRSPLNDAGIAVHEESAQRAAEDSRSYPYFVQLWGYYLFDGARARNRRAVDAEVEDAAAEAVAAVRDDYYFERWLEMERAPLRWPAVEVARRFGKAGGHVSRDRVRAAIEIGLGRHGHEAGEAAVDGVLDLFVDLGYVWERSGRSRGMQAGIPSLMSYVDARGGQVENEPDGRPRTD